MSDNNAAADTLNKQERLAAWVQFPRRVLFLLIAVAFVQAALTFMPNLLIAPEFRGNETGPVSLSSGQPVSRLIGDRLPNTLMLLGSTVICAIPLGIIFSVIALLTHRLETRTGPPGSVLKGLGRLSVFALGAAPALVLVTASLWLFVFQLKLGSAVIAGPGGRFNPANLFLPIIILTLAPGALIAQPFSHALTRPQVSPQRAVIFGAVFQALGLLFNQVGGLLSMMVLVETLFAMPGVGNLFTISIVSKDWPVTLGALSLFAYIVLVGQLIAEVFCWLARLQGGATLSSIQNQPTPWRITARRVWVGLSMVLLLLPVGVLFGGAFTNEQLALKTNISDSNQEPSAEYPWGTDRLGRDLQARVMRGLLSELGVAIVAALAACLISLPVSAIAAYLFRRRTWWADSIADVLLLPIGAAWLIPALPLAAIFLAIPSAFAERTLSFIIVILVLALLPRATLILATLWRLPSSMQMRFLAAPLAAWLLTALAGFALILSLDALGLGIQPPLPTAGEIFTADNLFAGRALFMPGLLVLMCALALHTAADGLIGYFDSKAALALRNT